MPRVDLSGLFPPIPTPFTATGEVDHAAFRANIQKWSTVGFQGFVVQGSNGEFVFLSEEERVAVVRTARAALSQGQQLIVGTGMEGTRQAIAMTRKMAEAGADAALVINPSFFKGRMTPAAIENHFRQVADASPIPVVLYNMPANTGIDMPAGLIIKLSAHPNIIGVKDSGGNVAKMAHIVQDTPKDFQVMAGSAGFLLATLLVGGVGGVCALANLPPAATELLRMIQLFRQGDIEGARAIQTRLAEANTAITAQHGVPGLKFALDRLGFYGGPVRAPLLPLPPADQELLLKTLHKTGVLQSKL